jgi:hypothetical protein
MGMKDITAGKYVAKAMEGAFGKIGANATPCVGVRFEFERAPGIKENIWHVMYLTDKAIEYTMDTLAGTLGYNENKDLIKKPDGNMMFDRSFLTDKEVEIVIEMEPDHKDPNKIYPRIKWVNELGGGSRFAGLSVTEVFGSINLKAAAAAARARKGQPKAAPVADTRQAAPQATEEDIPF